MSADSISLTDSIIAAQKSDPKEDTTTIEQEIDQIVYKLYELSPEKIKIVEK